MKSRILFLLLLFVSILLSGVADAATTIFFDSSQTATLVASDVTSDTISSNGYLFTYTRDKLFGGGTGRPVRIPWPEGVEAQAITVSPVGKAQITISRVDGNVFDIPAFTVKLLANTGGAGAAIEVMPQLNGEDGYPDPIFFSASGQTNQTFSYDTATTPQSTALLTGFDTYKINLYVDFALTAITLVDAGTPNTPPVAVDNAYATNAGVELTIAAPGVLGNDTDADGDPLTAILNVAPSNGTLTLNANGSFTYTPDANFTGLDTFTYHANDGTADSNIATVTITVTSIPVDTYTVVVRDTSAVAIAGADVAVDYPGTAPQTTDAGGQVTFSLPAGGTYLYTIAVAGYVTQAVSSDNTIVNVSLAEIDATITISGTVEDTTGAPLVGATVTAFQPDDIAVTYQAVSDAGGAYTIDLATGAPNSGYTVVAELAGFVSVAQTDQATGIVDFTGSNGLQAKTTITSVTATVAGTGVRLDITADPVFTAVSEADVTVTSTGGTGLLGPLSLAAGTIAVTYSAVEDFTVVIKADTSEDHDPNVGYFASSPFSYVADDPASDSVRMDVDAGGGTLNLTANGQTATVVVPAGGISRPATVVIKQIPKTVQASDTEGSPTYVYEVTAVDSNTGNPLTADEIIRVELTLPIDLDIVQPGDLEDGVVAIYQAADTFSLEAGDGTPVPTAQIISTNYVGDGSVGSVRFWVDHLSAFGAGAAAAVTPPPDGGGGGGGGGCFISTAEGSILGW